MKPQQHKAIPVQLDRGELAQERGWPTAKVVELRMRALVISDIHANLPALEAVLPAAPQYDMVWNLGDLVGYGAKPNQVVEVAKGFRRGTVRGLQLLDTALGDHFCLSACDLLCA